MGLKGFSDRGVGGLGLGSRHRRYEVAFAGIGGAFAFVDMDAFWGNSAAMLLRAGGKTIRPASKSLRCRGILRMILDSDAGYDGVLAYTLPEAISLAEDGFVDVVVAYPTVDSVALGRLKQLTNLRPTDAPVVMVDCVEHLDVIDQATSADGEPIRVCIDLDCAYWTGGERVKIGAKRSPIRTPEQAAALARAIAKRPSVRLSGLMAYESQVAGVGDIVAGHPLRSRVLRKLQSSSVAELAERRAAVVAAVSAVTPLEFVNGGGTGSIHTTAREAAVTDVAAGSGFYAPTLFDTYSSFRHEPAAIFALPIVRKPSGKVATALGGGYLASGVGAKDRMPTPYLPAGLKLDSMEGAGEVQTPLHGPAAGQLEIGDRVYMRHCKAGELCERFDSLLLVSGDQIVDELPTYRGEGHCFL